MVTCFIGIGSNLGDRHRYITTAITQLKSLPSTRVKRVSRIIETLPEGGPKQGNFLNCVVQLETELFPYPLLAQLQNIEASLGRSRSVKNGPRTIDLDILLYSDITIREDALCIPHPRIQERAFVLNPLREIAPDVVKALFGFCGKRNNARSKGSAMKQKKRAKRCRTCK